MRKLTGLCGLIGLTAIAASASADVAPLTAEGKVMVARQQALENAMRAAFDDATFNRVRDMHGSVIVAEEVRGKPSKPRVLVKDEHGWSELRRGGERPVPAAIAHELDRLLIDEAIASENPYVHAAPCAQPRLFILRHAGREQFGRQCTPAGIAGRAAEVAATGRIPPGRGMTTAPPTPAGQPRPGGGPGEDLARHIHHRASEMVWAWQRGSLAGAVEPYAQDVIVELPGGRVLRGRPALVEWMRGQQDWSTRGRGKRVEYHRGSIKPPEGDILFEMREIRWEEAGRPLRRTYSATWQNRDGLWQIAHERVSADKPVTGERQVW